MRTLCCVLLLGCTGPSIDETDSGNGTDGTDESDDPVLTDLDGDGYFSDVDCNDFDPEVRPNATEVLWNEQDDNCDGRIDADGGYQGQAAVAFVATVEGRTYRWDLTCPTTVQRRGWIIDFEVRCEPPAGDALALQVMGESFSYVEQENIAEQAEFSGSILVQSTDGWSVEGQGSLTWRGDTQVSGQGTMRSRFAQTSMSFTANYSD